MTAEPAHTPSKKEWHYVDHPLYSTVTNKELYDDAINPFTAEIMDDPHDFVASKRG